MYIFQSTLFMYDYINNRLPPSFNHIFPYNREIQVLRSTRQSNLLYTAPGVSNFSGSLPLYNFPRMWNEWNHAIPNPTSRAHFKSQVKNIYQPIMQMQLNAQIYSAKIVFLPDLAQMSSFHRHPCLCCPDYYARLERKRCL